MAKQKLSALAAPFQGKWRIAEMDVWDNEAIDLLGPAFIAFKRQEGEMRFIALTAWLDVRYDAALVGRSRNSPGKATTKATNARATAGLRSEPPDASSATSTSTAATIQASSANDGEFFNGLLGCRRASRSSGHRRDLCARIWHRMPCQ